MKRVICGLIAMTLIAISANLVLAGQTLNVDSRLWSQPNEQEFIVSEIFKPFEEANDVIINYHYMTDKHVLQRTKVGLKTDRVTQDVVIVAADRFATWVNRGYIEDLSPLVKSWSDRTYSKAFAGLATFNQKQFFLPVGGDVYLLIANKKALKYLPSGVDIQDISWEQLADWSNAVADGEGEGKFGWTGVPMKSLVYQYGGVSLSYGAKFPEMNSPGALKAWKVIAKMARGFSPGVRSYDNVTTPLKRGEIWLSTAHNVRVATAYESNPTQFVIAPVPKGPAGKGTIGGTSGMGIVKGAPNRDLAIKFIKYMTSPETMAKIAAGTGFIPTVDEAVSLLGKSPKDEILKKAMGVLKHGVVSFIDASPYTGWGKVKVVFDDVFDKMVLTDKKFSMHRINEGVQALKKITK